jgi:hypothetical protein
MMMETTIHTENYIRKSLFFIILIEFFLFIFSGVSFQGLHQVPYFNFGIDPVYWLFFLLQIPQLIYSHNVIGWILDISISILLMYSVLIKENKLITWILFILLTLYYVSLTATLGHRNYQTGFFIIIIPFLFSNPTNRKYAFEGIRYFYIFFYFSSGIFKIINHGIFEPSMMTSTLKQQFISYFLESNLIWRTTLNLLLINHWIVSYILFCSTVALESFFVIGFFTKKWDHELGILLIFFHFSNWIIMDISPIGQFSIIFYFLISNKFSSKVNGQ